MTPTPKATGELKRGLPPKGAYKRARSALSRISAASSGEKTFMKVFCWQGDGRDQREEEERRCAEANFDSMHHHSVLVKHFERDPYLNGWSSADSMYSGSTAHTLTPSAGSQTPPRTSRSRLNSGNLIVSSAATNTTGVQSLLRLLCGVVIRLDKDRSVAEERGLLNRLFDASVEGEDFRMLVAPADRMELDFALKKVTVASPRFLDATLLRNGGKGSSFNAKIIVVAASESTGRSAGHFLLGLRIEGTDGLTPYVPSGDVELPGADANNWIESSGLRQTLASLAVGHETAVNSVGTSPPVTLENMDAATSFAEYACSLSFSDCSSRTVASLERPRRSSESTLSSSQRVGGDTAHAKVQTDAIKAGMRGELMEAGTQTDASHVSRAASIQMPSDSFKAPQAPAFLRAGTRCASSNSSHSVCSSGDGSDCNPVQRTLSERLLLRHFQLTSLDTVAFSLDQITAFLNVIVAPDACCTWHACLQRLEEGVAALQAMPCKDKAWLPSSGWQCCTCTALLDITEGECAMCGGNRCLE